MRRDTFTERISEKVEYRRSDAKPIVFLRTPQGAMEIDAKPDGTSYLPEYLTFMDSCRISTGITEPIEEIILEEADAFFAGDKDARTVAGIIQSLVQLYLNENWENGLTNALLTHIQRVQPAFCGFSSYRQHIWGSR